MSVRGRVRVGVNTLIKGPKAVRCARSGDHVVRVLALRGAVSTMGLELFSFRFNVYGS